jgi:hypothetical protein
MAHVTRTVVMEDVDVALVIIEDALAMRNVGRHK